MNNKTLLKKLQSICDKIETMQYRYNEEINELFDQVADIYEAVYRSKSKTKKKTHKLV